MQSVFYLSLRLVQNPWFKTLINITILAAAITVGIQTYKLSSNTVRDYSDLLDTIDIAILTIFTIEVLAKILAEGKEPWNYFKNIWNFFDFLIVGICLLNFFVSSIDTNFIAVLRLIRILLVLKLIKNFPKLQMLVEAMIKSIPSIFYIGILLGLLFYIYATMGVFMFGENDPMHFGTLHKSMLSLFRVVTLEDWTDIMYINIYGCNHEVWGYDSESICINPKANPIISTLFFISFVLIGTMIMLNLFIGVTLNAMNESKAQKEEELALEKALQNEGNMSTTQQIEQINYKIDDLKKDLSKLKLRL